jgi:energy-converting hydrogenase Eha subunit E
MPYANMNSRKENLITILLILLGVIIVPVLFIWSADTIFALTIKTFLAAFFLLLLIRAVSRKEDEARHRQTIGKDEES